VGYESDIATELLAISCTFCGQPLRVPESIERGYGRDCDENYMMGMGTEMVLSQMRHFNEAEALAAIESAPDVEPEGWIEPVRVAKKGALLHDGSKAKGGEVLESRPLRPGSLRSYWLSKGEDWRASVSARQQMVSYGIWYASRAVTFGFSGDQVENNKADPRFLVVASVQRFARAVGMHAAADAMANFYAARVVKVVEAKLKQVDAEERDAIIFETNVPATHRPFRDPLGPGFIRIHAPYSDQFNRLARENHRVFRAFEKDPPYFWRYFHESSLREVVNICQAAFGDRMSITRSMVSASQRAAQRAMVRVIDSWTGEIRLFDRATAKRILAGQPQEGPKSRLRYQEV
jgi:hypothetical protein